MIQLSKWIAHLLTLLLFFPFCDITSKNEPLDPAPLVWGAEPDEELRFMVEETPGDFTRGFFEDNLLIFQQYDVEWEGE